jgi:hypothetical protein
MQHCCWREEHGQDKTVSGDQMRTHDKRKQRHHYLHTCMCQRVHVHMRNVVGESASSQINDC